MKIIRSLLVLPLFIFLGTGCENIFSDSGDNQFEKWKLLPIYGLPGNISIAYPDSSATWWWGKQDVEISWEQKNPAGTVTLELYKEDTFINTIVSSTPNDGVYNSYTVPSGLSADFDYRVRISDASGHFAFSEYFTIANYLIKITQSSGTINGAEIYPADPEIVVEPGAQLSGSLNVIVTNNMPAGAIAPLAATPTWGDPQSSYWEIDNWVGTGETGHVVDVDLTAPSEPGTYYIVIAMAGTYNSAQIMSGTHPGEPADWINGNIVALLNESEFGTAIDQGYINFRWYHSVNGDMGGTMAMTAVRVVLED